MTMSIQEFVESQRGHTSLAWLAGNSGATRRLGSPEQSTVDRVGYLNVVHLNRVGVLGPHEIAWFNKLDPNDRMRLLAAMTEAEPPALIISDNMPAPDELIAYCDEVGQPLLGSPIAAPLIIESLRYFLSQETQDTTSLHGVMMDVLGMGVLISGDSGLGKSELALELISRGHGLVADDVVEIHRLGPAALECRCPPLLQGLLEVRGLGLLDIKTVFGETAVRRKMRLKLIVHLVRPSTMESQYERMPLQELTQDILGVPVRKVVIPVAAGRNLAVLTEAAVRSTVLLLRGIDTTREFVERQQRAIRESSGQRDEEAA
ncbi:MAG: HPr(Ser) kinase/phosphatase [Burkholderiaceae bacterium]